MYRCRCMFPFLLLSALVVPNLEAFTFPPSISTSSIPKNVQVSSTLRPSLNNYQTLKEGGRRSCSTPMVKTHLSSSLFPLVSSTDKWGNIAVLTATASVSQNLGKTTAIGRLLGPPVTAMAIAFTLGSIGVLSGGGTPYGRALQLLSIQIATPLLLLGADIRECRKSCGPLLIGFILASIGTVLGSIAAIPFCGVGLSDALGVEGLKIASALMAKNIGGGVNYVAVCQALSASPLAIAAGLCVDNVFALVYFPITSILAKGRPDVEETAVSNDMPDSDGEEMNTEDISSTLAFACLMTWLGTKFGGSASLPVSTLLTVIFTTVFPMRAKKMKSVGEMIGTACLYIFFATAGAPGLSIADSLKSAFVPISIFLTLLYSVHGLFLYLVRKFILLMQGEDCDNKVISPQRLLVASSAAIGGPSTAAALAKAQGWDSLISSSLIVGNLGYAIATFIGIGFYKLFSPV